MNSPRIVLILAALMSGAAPAAQAAETPGLYGARTIVTGTDERSRPAGLQRCLADVLVKLSGNPALADARLPDAAPLLQDLAYLDRMSDQPHHDEQGSRDRPYDLLAAFDPARIDTLLATLGEAPWLDSRPRLAARITLRRGAWSAPMLADTDADERQRGALLAAADRYGLQVALPLNAADVPDRQAVPLDGTLTWSDAAFGWVGEWTLTLADHPHRWTVTGVSFDEAFRNLLRGALQILSGHGDPAPQSP